MKIKYLAMAMAALLVVSCGKKKDAEAAVDELPQVKIATVSSQDVAQTEEYTATVESDVKNNIAPNAPLRIEKILVEVGDNVSKGQCVVRLDQSNLDQLKLNIANQQSVIDNFEIDFNRIEQLYKVGGVSKAEYDNAKVNLNSQKTQLNVLKSQLAQLAKNTALYAPISGVVTTRNYDDGDMYSGQPVLTIEQTNPVKILCNVSENHYKELKKGQAVDITLDAYEGEVFTGKVTIVYPSVDVATHTFPVEITINNPAQKVRPGMFARATISFGSKNHVLIPDEALVKQIGAGDRYVYVYDPKAQTVSYNKIELGKHINDTYEIISGVNVGDQVVIAGQSRLANGKKVKVVK
ncbi:MAG: efflux RND transporter periplasmic adaptor subunit [Prevotellaceae bacterium]|nr:efflux RND transporter periplasmic adaptor subunit [Prevotellaceae bacterium]